MEIIVESSTTCLTVRLGDLSIMAVRVGVAPCWYTDALRKNFKNPHAKSEHSRCYSFSFIRTVGLMNMAGSIRVVILIKNIYTI